jgi:hypothetical protein
MAKGARGEKDPLCLEPEALEPFIPGNIHIGHGKHCEANAHKEEQRKNTAYWQLLFSKREGGQGQGGAGPRRVENRQD